MSSSTEEEKVSLPQPNYALAARLTLASSRWYAQRLRSTHEFSSGRRPGATERYCHFTTIARDITANSIVQMTTATNLPDR